MGGRFVSDVFFLCGSEESEERELTNGVNDLVDHYFTKLEFLMIASTDILRNHCRAIEFRVRKTWSSIRLSVGPSRLQLIVIIQRTNGCGLPNSSVSLCSCLVVLPPQV